MAHMSAAYQPLVLQLVAVLERHQQALLGCVCYPGLRTLLHRTALGPTPQRLQQALDACAAALAAEALRDLLSLMLFIIMCARLQLIPLLQVALPKMGASAATYRAVADGNAAANFVADATYLDAADAQYRRGGMGLARSPSMIKFEEAKAQCMDHAERSRRHGQNLYANWNAVDPLIYTTAGQQQLYKNVFVVPKGGALLAGGKCGILLRKALGHLAALRSVGLLRGPEQLADDVVDNLDNVSRASNQLTAYTSVLERHCSGALQNAGGAEFVNDIIGSADDITELHLFFRPDVTCPSSKYLGLRRTMAEQVQESCGGIASIHAALTETLAMTKDLHSMMRAGRLGMLPPPVQR